MKKLEDPALPLSFSLVKSFIQTQPNSPLLSFGDKLWAKHLIASMAAGSGMGAAAVFERGDSVNDLCNTRTVKDINLLSKDAR